LKRTDEEKDLGILTWLKTAVQKVFPCTEESHPKHKALETLTCCVPLDLAPKQAPKLIAMRDP